MTRMELPKKRYYLGVDGGGTSTTAAVADASGKILGTGKAGPSLYKVVGLPLAISNITRAVRNAEREAKIKPGVYAYSVFGLSGVDSLNEWKMLSELVYRHCKGMVREAFRVVNDVVIAFAAGSRRPYGAAVIAGTGSNAYAVGEHGEEAYAGGLGTRLADEGSGYWIGSRMLHAAAKSFDTRGPKTMLEPLVLRALKVRHMRDAVDVVYRAGFDKTKTASLAPLAFRAAKKGDNVACKIVDEAAHELADAAVAVIKRTGLAKKQFDIVLAGSLFKAGIPLLSPFTEYVRHAAPQSKIQVLRTAPVTGAIKLACAAATRV